MTSEREWPDAIAVQQQTPPTSDVLLIWKKDGHCWQTAFYDADDGSVSAEEWFGQLKSTCDYWMPLPPEPALTPAPASTPVAEGGRPAMLRVKFRGSQNWTWYAKIGGHRWHRVGGTHECEAADFYEVDRELSDAQCLALYDADLSQDAT